VAVGMSVVGIDHFQPVQLGGKTDDATVVVGRVGSTGEDIDHIPGFAIWCSGSHKRLLMMAALGGRKRCNSIGATIGVYTTHLCREVQDLWVKMQASRTFVLALAAGKVKVPDQIF